MGDSHPFFDRSRLLVLVGTVLVALNLRPAIASVSPVLETIRADLALGHTAASLLTTIPTLCMGIFAFVSVPITRRLGRLETVLWASVLMAVATGLRIAGDSVVVLFVSTLLVGIGIAVTQTVLPSVVQEYFADRTGLVTGLYTTSLIVGAALAAGLTAPISAVAGGSWVVGLAVWTIPAVVGVIAWLPAVYNDELERANTAGARRRLPWRRGWAWFLVVFFAGSSLLYFVVLAWLSPLYVDLGWSEQRAGLVLTAFSAAQLFGAFASTYLSDRFTDRRPPMAFMLSCSIVGLFGAAVMPLSLPWLWAVLMGAGIGGQFALVLTLPVDHARTPAATGRLTSMLFGVGYVLAAIGPSLVGWLRSVSGDYRLPFLVTTAIAVGLLLSSVLVRPSRTIDA